MDADNSAVGARGPSKGGNVEPVNRVAVVKERFQIPDDIAAEHYELRDPFAEVTYRANTFPQMVAKAEQLGSSLLFAVAEDGKRTAIRKVSGEWQPQRAAEPARPVDRSPTGHEGIDVQTTGAAPGEARTPAPPTPVTQSNVDSLARIDVRVERAALVARLEAALKERYIIRRAPVTVGDVTIGRTEYRFRGDTSRVAFTESTFRLATDTNSPSVARSMVDVAEARNWRALRVSGHEDFKRLVWLEASARGVKTVGYEPQPGDLELVERQREMRLVNRIEPTREAIGSAASSTSDKASGRGGGRKAVLAAIEAILIAKRVPETRRAAVLKAATEKLSERIHNGQAPKIRIYDQSAPPQRPARESSAENQRSRDRAAPAPVR